MSRGMTEVETMKLSHKGRPICGDENCTVEIGPTQTYCDAHNYYQKMELEKAA